MARVLLVLGLLFHCAIVPGAVRGPDTVPPCAMVELEADGINNSWIILEPASLEYKLYEAGKYCVFSSGTGQVTKVVVLCVNWDAKRIERHTVTVASPGPPLPPPTPDDGYLGLTKLARDNAPPGIAATAVRLSKCYYSVAADIDGGVVRDLPSAMDRLRVCTNTLWSELGVTAQAPWNPWAAKIQAVMERSITEVGELSKACTAIANGLKQHADNVKGVSHEKIRSSGIKSAKTPIAIRWEPIASDDAGWCAT